MSAPTGSTGTEPLDDAMSVVRAISKRVAIAAGRGDTAALERFSAQRKIATAEVDRLLRVVGARR